MTIGLSNWVRSRRRPGDRDWLPQTILVRGISDTGAGAPSTDFGRKTTCSQTLTNHRESDLVAVRFQCGGRDVPCRKASRVSTSRLGHFLQLSLRFCRSVLVGFGERWVLSSACCTPRPVCDGALDFDSVCFANRSCVGELVAQEFGDGLPLARHFVQTVVFACTELGRLCPSVINDADSSVVGQ